MADSFQPWIGHYLIDIAETLGANLTAIPYFAKKKKAQLVEFITYDLNTQNDCIWGKISDKEYKLPVRFTREAMSGYNSLNTRRLTEHKTALLSITDFQPFFARIPLANKKGMSKTACVALNIRSFSIVGSSGEAEWGRPRDIETNADLSEWSEGLRKDGGQGNVLMDRRKERAKISAPDAPPIKSPRKMVSNGSPHVGRKHDHIGSKASSSKKVDKAALPAKNIAQADLLKEYERSWRPISLNTGAYSLKPRFEQTLLAQGNIISDKVPGDSLPLSPVRPQSNDRRSVPRGRHALDLTSERGTPPNENSPSRNLRPRIDPSTPPEWSPSVRGSQALQDESEDETNSEHELLHKSSTAPSLEVEKQPDSAPRDDSTLPNTFTTEVSSHPSPPTPAQRPKPYVPPTTSSPPPLFSAPFPFQTPAAEFLPTPKHVTPTHSTPNDRRRKVMRKVPHPGQPPPKSSMSGPAHILVPSSDTSGTTASQPHSRSQPATQSMLSSERPILPHTQEEPEDQHSHRDNKFHSPFGVRPPDEETKSPPNQSTAAQDPLPRPPSPYGDDHDGPMNAVRGSPSQKISATNDSGAEGEGSDKDQSEQDEDEVDGLQEEETESRAEHSRSIVPGSQEGQLDEDDAEIDEMLFGLEESTHGERSSAATSANRAQAFVKAVSGRDSSGSTETGTKSHKRSREASLEDMIALTMGGSKRRKLADMAPPSGASGSRQKRDQSEGGPKVGEVATLGPTQEGGNPHLAVNGKRSGGRKLQAFQADFDNILCDDEKGWPFSWEHLKMVLLQTGRKRHMEQKQRAAQKEKAT